MVTRIATLVTILLLAVGALAQDQQAIRTQFFAETDAVKAQADALHAAVLAPESYAKGMELYTEAGDTLARGRDLDDVREDLAESKQYFEQAVERATLAQTTFSDALVARKAAQDADAEQFAARGWRRAEEDLGKAAEVLEGGNLNRASEMGMDVQKLYREIEAEAINAKAKSEAR